VTRGLVKFDAWPAGIAPKPFTLLFKPGDELLEISLLTGPRLFLPFEFQMPPVDVRDCVGDLNQRRVHGLDGKGGIDDVIEPPVVRNFIPDSLSLFLFAGLIDGVESGIGLDSPFPACYHRR
jgi:hypothetical protein